MQDISPFILNYLDRVLIQEREPAYFVVDRSGILQEIGGNLAAYHLGFVQLQKSMTDQIHFLEGLLPLESDELLLPCIEVSPRHFADVHLLRIGSKDVVLLVDATTAEIQEGLLHQKANDLFLLRSHHSNILNLLTGLDIALLERIGEMEFRVIGTAAEWLEYCGLRYKGENTYEIASSLEFLHNFVSEAEESWQTDNTRLKSGPWVETAPGGMEWYFEATAMRTGKQEIFLIERVAPYTDMRFALLQKAREQSLEYLRLARKEKELREKEFRERILLQAVPDWIFRINKQGKVLDLKATMGKNPSMFAQFIGQPLSEVFPEDVSNKIVGSAQDSLASNQLQTCHFQLGSSEASIEFEARVVAVGPNEVVVIIRDLQEMER